MKSNATRTRCAVAFADFCRHICRMTLLATLCGASVVSAGDFLKVDINSASSATQDGWRSYTWTQHEEPQAVVFDGISTKHAPSGSLRVTIATDDGFTSAKTVYAFDRAAMNGMSDEGLAKVYRDGIISDAQYAKYFFYIKVKGLNPNTSYRFRALCYDYAANIENRVRQVGNEFSPEAPVVSTSGHSFEGPDDRELFMGTRTMVADADGMFVAQVRGHVGQARLNGFVLGEFPDAGLDFAYCPKAAWDESKVTAAYVDVQGATYAYEKWPDGKDIIATYHYQGYVCVPGTPGEKTNCNFMTSFLRRAKVKIGGKLVVHTDDNKDMLNGGAPFSNGFLIGQVVEVESGWQPIEISLENWYNGAGPRYKEGWGYFGLGVDWQGRRTENSADYDRFQDPGDGSFLRTALVHVECEDDDYIVTAYYDYGFGTKDLLVQPAGHQVAQIGSLTKKGEGELSLMDPMIVSGDLTVLEGALRLGAQIPPVEPGLWCEYSLNAQYDADKVVEAYADSTGARYAYDNWPNPASNNWMQSYRYTGYVLVPGSAGEKVRCNFVSSVLRRCRLWIQGKEVIHTEDNMDRLTNTPISNRFYLGPIVELDAGWQQIELRVENWWSGGAGAIANGDWPANFGVGVDWQGRCKADSANYTQFRDSGDGSFLRGSLAAKDSLDVSRYRPTFGGAAYFAPGTVFDINDYDPYVPVALPSLSGFPTVVGGSVFVTSGEWSVSAADVLAGKPLVVCSGAELLFSGSAFLSLDLGSSGDDALPRRAGSRYPVLRIESGGEARNLPRRVHSSTRLWHLVDAEDGEGLDLVYRCGLSVIVR